MPPKHYASLAALVTALFALLIYGLTLTPGVGLIDSGELTLAAWLPGNAHPPGVPLYLMLGYLVTHLPLGSVALRLNIFSAVCAALAAGLVALGAWLAQPDEPWRPVARAKQAKPAKGGPAKPVEPEDLGVPGWLPALPALAAGLAFAFSRSLWNYAVVAEVYTLTIALLAGAWVALLAWRRRRKAPGSGAARHDRLVYLAAFLSALAFSVHSASALVMAPALVLFVLAVEWPLVRLWWQRVSSGRRVSLPAGAARPAYWAFWRMAGLAALAALAGLLVYLYLPLRAAGSPLLNWGDPDTAEMFWWHVTGKWYQLFFETSQVHPIQRLVNFIVLLLEQHWLIGSLGVLLGAWFLWGRDNLWLLCLLLVLAVNAVFFGAYDVVQDQQAYAYPALPALAWLIGAGVYGLLRAIVRRWGFVSAQPRPAAAALGVLVALVIPALALAGNYRANDHHADYLAENFAGNLLASMEPNALLLTAEWDATVAPLLYAQHVRGDRPDVTVIDINLVKRSWYVDYVRQVDPELYAAVETSYAEFLRNLYFFEHDSCAKPSPPRECSQIQASFENLINNMGARAIAAGRPVYVTGEVDLAVDPSNQDLSYSVLPGSVRVPYGLVYRIYNDNQFRGGPSPTLDLRGLTDGTVPLLPNSTPCVKVLPLYAGMFSARATYLRDEGQDEAGAAALDQQAAALNAAIDANCRQAGAAPP